MDDTIFKICEFQNGPLTKENYITALSKVLGQEDATATITKQDLEQIQKLQAQLNEEIAAEEKEGEKTAESKEDPDSKTEIEEEEDEEEEELTGGTTPLHALIGAVDPSISGDDLEIVLEMLDTLFLYGAGWVILDENDETPGCIALRRKLPREIYNRIVYSGVRAEVLLSRLTEEEEEEEEEEVTEENEKGDTAQNQEAYLDSKLEYTDHNLVTSKAKDGVMMDWEDPIMKRSAELITTDSEEDGSGPIVLNVGFGMGIIDKYIQDLKPKRHFICEAHPEVLAKMRADGWYEKPGVTILEGPWKKTLPDLLDQCCSEQMYFDGIYYDTFSEHYRDLKQFFDFVVGIMKPTGTFSFFNGLGADRQVCYDVYKQVVELDLCDYGLEVKYEEIDISPESKTWEGIRKQYWAINKYALPIIRFMS